MDDIQDLTPGAITGSPGGASAPGEPPDVGDGVEDNAGAEGADQARPSGASKKRRRGSRGGRGRKKPASAEGAGTDSGGDEAEEGDEAEPAAEESRPVTPRAPRARQPRPTRAEGAAGSGAASQATSDVELPDRISEGRPSPEAASEALVRRKPRIGDTMPAPVPAPVSVPLPAAAPAAAPKAPGGKGRGKGSGGARGGAPATAPAPAPAEAPDGGSKRRRRGGKPTTARSVAGHGGQVQLDADALERRRGRERKGRPVGRYMMCVHVGHGLTQVAVLEGRNLIEHYVSRPADDVSHIHGNIYLGRVQNVLPGMEAAFVDIATPKNAVLYAGDVQYDPEDIVERSSDKPRIEQMLKSRQLILSQVTKNPIGVKGARLTQEVSLPGRFVVLIPNSKTYGISKRLPDDQRKRLRSVLDRVKEPEHGLIVRTAAEHATEAELRADVQRLNETWREIERRADAAREQNRAQLLYREPDLAVRVIREEFNAEYRSIVIDDPELYQEVRGYVEVMNPELADRVELYDAAAEGLPLYERFHIHEQLHKALDRKVWLQSGGSLIIEHTEALTVIDVNTGKNVGSSSLEQTVLHNNLEAAEEIARQLRLRDIGGIIVIDFIDMEVKENRRKVVEAFRDALARDKTRSQVFEISELGLVEMTRKRIGEGLLQSFADQCPHCEGRGVRINHALLD